MKQKKTTCGVVVATGGQILLGHATRSPRWDIPKGEAEPGEDFAAAAARELDEETGLKAAASDLEPLGVHRYLSGKDLALFVWTPAAPPNAKCLICHSTFTLPNGAVLPEFDRFGLFSWDEALSRVGKNMARVLAAIGPAAALKEPSK